ncbi:outer spore coat protein CotE [Aneurinibacillus terranovensis]|uniref:outer spore coat protein CotE n=1 Tax=Aneurinibacillus terranovensis TaxID=278991 RepID=UPI00042654C8|nr:outer spore coat protein CotE [Aneurinibacillus terranovensis]
MSSTDKEMQCREIVTKAVCGKGRKYSTAAHTVTPSHHSLTILGCWVINHVYKAVQIGEAVEVSGSYEVNIWYSYNNNTETTVQKETIKFVDTVPLSYYDSNCRGDVEVTARVTQDPHCVEAKLTGGKIVVTVEREYSVEVVGETKLCVVICDSCDDDYKEELYADTFDDLDEFTDLDLEPDKFID